MRYKGKSYHINKDGYFIRTIELPLHKVVYEDNFGEIPRGFIIHHKDKNKQNNDPSNLEAIPEFHHLRYSHTGRLPKDVIAVYPKDDSPGGDTNIFIP